MGKRETEYITRYREKLKAKGLKKMEVWCLPEHKHIIKKVELSLRKGDSPKVVQIIEREFRTMDITKTVELYDLLTNSFINGDVANNGFTLSLTEGDDPVIVASLDDMEEFPIFITVSGDQILANVNLLDVAALDENQQNVLNRVLLEMNTVVPLSNFAIVGGAYVLSGALSVNSKLEVIVEELVVLAGNIVGALELIDEVVG